MNELATKYNPAEVEDKWYAYWMEHRLFHSEPRRPRPILHSDSAAQRYGRAPYGPYAQQYHTGHPHPPCARMEGRMHCGCPAQTIAAISTEAKVVAKLTAEGIKKTDLSREEFLSHAWDWTPTNTAASSLSS